MCNRLEKRTSLTCAGMQDAPLKSGHEPPLGAHLVTRCAFYTHHGIYIGGGRVIHYAGLAHGLRRGPVEAISLESFARSRTIRIRQEHQSFDPHEVMARARSRLGECNYRILTNNCEHLCAWALRGEFRSQQVERLLRAPRLIVQYSRAVARRLGFAIQSQARRSANSSVVLTRNGLSARLQAMTWSSSALSSAMCRWCGLNSEKFSKSVVSESATCDRTSAT